MSDSLQPYGLYSPWNSPCESTGVGSLSLLQRIFPTQGSNPGLLHCRHILYQLSHKGSPRILEWVAYTFSSWSSQPRNQTGVSCIAGRFFTNWAIKEAIKRRNWYGWLKANDICLIIVLETVSSKYLLTILSIRYLMKFWAYNSKNKLWPSSSLSLLFSEVDKPEKVICIDKHTPPHIWIHTHICYCSVAQSCLTPLDPMGCSTLGLPFLHHLPELAQTHVHWVSDAIQPSHPLLPPSPPALNLSLYQGLF